MHNDLNPDTLFISIMYYKILFMLKYTNISSRGIYSQNMAEIKYKINKCVFISVKSHENGDCYVFATLEKDFYIYKHCETSSTDPLCWLTSY